MEQTRSYIKLISSSLIALFAAPSLAHSSSVFPFEENPEAFKDFMNKQTWADADVIFKNMRSCSRSYLNSTDTIYQCKDSSWTSYSMKSDPERSGRWECLSGGVVSFIDKEYTTTYRTEAKNCSGSWPRPFKPYADNYRFYLNREKVWDNEPKIIFHHLGNCRFYDNGKRFSCSSGNVTYNNWRGTYRCEVDYAAYNEETRRHSFKRGWCREANLLENLEIIRW